jgi:signal transduction histidine kinase
VRSDDVNPETLVDARPREWWYDSATPLAELVTESLVQIIGGSYNIDIDIVKEVEDFARAQILAGLVLLNEDLNFQRLQARQVHAEKEAKSAASLINSERRYALAMERFHGFIWILDGLECIEWNVHLDGHSGTVDDGVQPGSPLADLVGEDDPVRLASRRALLGDRTTLDWRWQGRIYQVTVAPTSVKSQGPAGASVVALDVTEQRGLEHRTREARRLEALGQLAGGVAHDFNNLLTIIKNSAHLIEESVDLEEETEQDLSHIHEAADRAAALVQQLLAFGGRQFRSPQVIELNNILSELTGIIQAALPEDVEFSTEFEPSCGRVHVDRSQLEQVLMNLVVNARDAMPDGGILCIETRRLSLSSSDDRSPFGLDPGNYAVITVSDSGVGMDEHVRMRVFEPFFTTKIEDGGTGLGLSTTYGIVKQSGGNITVYSEPGQGTTFKVYLPNTQEAVSPLKSTVDIGLTPLSPLTILYVEDEAGVRKATERILQRAGHAVVTASNADDAISLTSRWNKPPDLLMTDVVMTGMNGRQLAEHLRARWPELPVLYMSGYSQNVVVKKGVLIAGTHMVTKPFKPHVLHDMIRLVMASPQASHN